MNERITTIMQKCFDISIDHRGREDCSTDYAGIEKFVQLIVQECIKEIETAVYRDSCEFEDWEYGYNSALNKAKELIATCCGIEP
jgi:hypothetical protein